MRYFCFASYLLIILACAGCAHYPVNAPLSDITGTAGYRYGNIIEATDSDKPLVILAFSGGGTRAAAFSFGLMEELREVKYKTSDGKEHRLLDDVEIISSISGGSFTAAYYALFPDQFFDQFPDKFLYRNIQSELIQKLLNPVNLAKVASSDYSRIDLASDLYSKTIFENKTYGDLLKNTSAKSPFLVLNATDISIAHRFEFTQDQFDLICSDLASVDIGRAVAASSNFPLAFAPLTLTNYKDRCGALPEWVTEASDINNDRSRYLEGLVAKSYRDPDRKYTHLLDGGLSDNLGLRGPLHSLTSTDGGWSVLARINRDHLSKIIVIAANAKTTSHPSWDKSSKPPGLFSVLGVVTNGPMDTVSADSVEMTSNHFDNLNQLSRTVDSCNKYYKASCPDAAEIVNPFSTKDFSFSELSFDDIPDPHLKACLQELPTTFALPRETIDLLRASARYLLMNSQSFIDGMKLMDTDWVPRKVLIDQKLVTKVCGSGTAASH